MSEEVSMLSEVTDLDTEGLKILDDYWGLRRKYEAVFGKILFSEAIAQGPLRDKMKAMANKLDEHYRQQAQSAEKRKPELATA